MTLFDTHAHYTDNAFHKDREELLGKLLPAAGVGAVVVPGVDVESSRSALALAEEYGVTVTDFAAVPMIRLAVDGDNHIEEEGPMGTTWRAEYEEVMSTELFLSASGYEALTGEHVDLPAARFAASSTRRGASWALPRTRAS